MDGWMGGMKKITGEERLKKQGNRSDERGRQSGQWKVTASCDWRNEVSCKFQFLGIEERRG